MRVVGKNATCMGNNGANRAKRLDRGHLVDTLRRSSRGCKRCSMTIVNVTQYEAVVAVVRDLTSIKDLAEEALLSELNSAIRQYETAAFAVKKMH